jgi:hypothetical protein
MSAQQAAAATQQSMYSLSRATQAVQAMQAAQTAAHNLALQPGSLTSVSAGGLMIPYGSTVDGTNWAFNNTRC